MSFTLLPFTFYLSTYRRKALGTLLTCRLPIAFRQSTRTCLLYSPLFPCWPVSRKVRLWGHVR
jgi:hypothetical protein